MSRYKKWNINPMMAKLPFAKFKAWYGEDDAEEVYVKLGGKLPKKRRKKGGS